MTKTSKKKPSPTRDPVIARMVNEVSAAGVRNHSDWSQDILDSFVEHRLDAFLEGSPSDANSPRLAAGNFLAVISEGIGCGYLRRPFRPYSLRWDNLLEAFACTMQPASYAPDELSNTFVDVWNLNEGLMKQPEWMNAYVMTTLEFSGPWSQLSERLVEALTPVLTSSRPVDWGQPLTTTVVSPENFDRGFLPGEITPIAPRVVSIRDRRRETQLGLLLREQGESLFLGPLSDVEPLTTSEELPEVLGTRDAIQVGQQSVAAPYLGEPLNTAVLPSGFVVATARNSQRVWVVESVR